MDEKKDYFIRDRFPVPWSECVTAEDYAKKALREGKIDEAARLIRFLSEESKQRCRDFLKELRKMDKQEKR